MPRKIFVLILISVICLSSYAQNFDTAPKGFASDHMSVGANTRGANIQLNNMPQAAAASAVDTGIAGIVSRISVDRVRGYIQGLQNFGTRNAIMPNRDMVANWLKNQFLNMGYTDVVIDSFYAVNAWQKNIIATLPGRSNPSVWLVAGGHYDCYSPVDTMAPGADDNASGTTAVLEMARVIKQSNYNPENTLKFVAFGAEEYGLYGSQDYAQKCAAQGRNIKIMINFDMISTSTQPLPGANINVINYTGAESWANLTKSLIPQYSVLTAQSGGSNSSGSDSYSFYRQGYPAVYFEENQFSPVYHTTGDSIGNCNVPFCAEVIKAGCATMVYSDKMPDAIVNYKLENCGTGNSLQASWSPIHFTAFKNYVVKIGTASGVYTRSFNTTDTVTIIDGLAEGVKYYVAVSAVSSSNIEGLWVEKFSIPTLQPASPVVLAVEPDREKIVISWKANDELDIKGYNIYRASTSAGTYVKLNSVPVVFTSYVDNSAQGGVYYSYELKAVDSSGIESPAARMKGRLVTMNKGILLVNETKAVSAFPTAQQVDDFYTGLLNGFRFDTVNVNDYSKVTLSDLDAYSTIVWHGNDLQDVQIPYASRSELTKYFNFGGKFLFTIYKPAAAFMNSTNLINSYSAGSFIYDYLKIDKTVGKLLTKFIGAKPAAGYTQQLYVDTTKTTSSSNYHLTNIESISSYVPSQNIYTYDSRYDSTSVIGSLKGYPVGVAYLDGPYKAVTLSFPLFYIKQEQAAGFVRDILRNKFNEALAVENDNRAALISDFELAQNYPNPFNPVTKLRFSVPVNSKPAQLVTLKVFDVLGNLVQEVVNDYKPAGMYEVDFDGSKLASGIYYYQLKSGNFSAARKMILLK